MLVFLYSLMNIELELERILLLESLRFEREHTGHSLLRTAAESLTQTMEKQFAENLALWESAYLVLLKDTMDTERVIATGQDYLSVMEKEDPETWRENIEGFKFVTRPGSLKGIESEELALGRAESHLYAQLMSKTLQDDPSGFSLVTQLSSQHQHKDSTDPFLRKLQYGKEKAAKDYKELYLLGAHAGLGPLPKE